MTPTERAELETAIREHLPGLPDGAVEWDGRGAVIAVGAVSVGVNLWRWADAAVAWSIYPKPRRSGRGGARPDTHSALAAVRAHFEAALATARADVAAYERALGGTR